VELLDFEVEQYRALRAEILRSMEDGNQIIGFGVAALALVAHAGLTSKSATFAIFVFAVLVPLLGAVVLSMWFAAQERTARASHFLSGIERRITRDISKSATWESWLRGSGRAESSRHFWSTEHAAFGLFGTIIVSSVSFSATIHGSTAPLAAHIALFTTSIVLCATIAANLFRRFRQWKRWLSTMYSEDPAGTP
jgi:hypothetical protein